MNFKSSNGAVFVQTLGPNTRPRFIGCVDVDALNETGGAIDTLIRCFRTDGQGWDTVNATYTPPEPVTTTLTTLIEGSANSLELVKNGLATLFIHQRDGGKADAFSNFIRSWALEDIFIGERTVNDIAMREEDNPSTMAFGISAMPPLYKIFQKTAGRIAIGTPEAVNAITFCGIIPGLEQIGFAVTDATSGSPSDEGGIWYTRDGGLTWTETTTQPFAGAENVSGVACFALGRNTTRVVVTRGTTDVAAPMEIAYSDNWGLTWTVVAVGSVNGQFAPGAESIFALDAYNIWLVAGNGYIYYSDDAGLTWTTQNAGVATVNALWAINFVTDRIGYAVGAADTILKTEDGGQSWTATLDNTGVVAIIRTLDVLDSDHVWVGTSTGRLWYTEDGGETWEERAFGGGTGIVSAVKFADGSSLFGFMLHNTAVPVGSVYSTIDGGHSWDLVTTFTNTGLNNLFVIDLNTAYVTGEVQGGTGVLGKVFAKP